MAHEVNRGEIWMYNFASPNKARPVLVLSAPPLIRALHQVTVAEISSTLHDSRAEVVIGIEEGMKHICAINLINISNVPKARLREYRGTVGADKMRQVCRALAAATGCGQ